MIKGFDSIHQYLVKSGYPESHDSEWFIRIDEYKDNLIVGHYYDCVTRERAKAAAKVLLNNTDIYSVVVYNPICQPISFHNRFNKLTEHEWRYYFN